MQSTAAPVVGGMLLDLVPPTHLLNLLQQQHQLQAQLQHTQQPQAGKQTNKSAVGEFAAATQFDVPASDQSAGPCIYSSMQSMQAAPCKLRALHVSYYLCIHSQGHQIIHLLLQQLHSSPHNHLYHTNVLCLGAQHAQVLAIRWPSTLRKRLRVSR